VRRIPALLVGLLLVAGAAPADAEVTQQELRDARATMNARAAELDGQLAELDRILLQKTAYETRIADLEDQVVARDREIALSSFAAKEQARAMYVGAGAATVRVAGAPEDITADATRDAYLKVVVDSDTDAVNRLHFLQVDQATLQAELGMLVQDQEDLAVRAEAISQEMQEKLASANEEYQALYSQWQKEEAARIAKARAAAQAAAAQAAAAAAAASNYSSSAFVDPSGRTCPVAGANTFRDSWLEPRDYRNGLHHGTDMIAAEGTPLVAIESGTITSVGYHWAGGNGLYLRGASGDVYYYAHLQKYAGGITGGSRVSVGQVIGYVGHTGAASVSHLHIGYQPGGGPMVNPYQLMVKLCR
jgi:murein DD-endopeptidase MepM/ murein hydrolase activator NlpD